MKYFIVSDIHSFYTPLMSSLKSSGFNINNPDHILVVNGDLFDRGEETSQLLRFIKVLPKERRVLILGNHEYLLRSLLDKEYPESYDFSNGTVFTCYQLYVDRHPNAKIAKEYKKFIRNYGYLLYDYVEVQKFNFFIRENLTTKQWKYITNDIKGSGLLDWIFNSGEWVNYFELDKYIITHSFIPLYQSYGTYFDITRYEPNWRTNATPKQWYEATWGCPYSLYDDGYFDEEKKKGKILICGHWHAKDFHVRYENKYEDNTTYISDNLIAIDACTVISGFVNVLVIDDKDYFPIVC